MVWMGNEAVITHTGAGRCRACMLCANICVCVSVCVCVCVCVCLCVGREGLGSSAFSVTVDFSLKGGGISWTISIFDCLIKQINIFLHGNIQGYNFLSSSTWCFHGF